MKKVILILLVVVFLIGTSAFAQDTTIHSDGLTVNGTLESTNGGVIFPDGSIQTTECSTALCNLYELTGNTKPDFCFQCSDGLDNDDDGFVDYPNDPECLSAKQDDEDGVKTVFVTSGGYHADFGGVNEADALCQYHADSAGLIGTFKAWISEGAGTDPNTRYTKSTTLPYVLTNGTQVALDWNDLTDGMLINPISYDENGVANTAVVDVWTNTLSDGTYQGNNHCSGWTSRDSQLYAIVGDERFQDTKWTVIINRLCDRTAQFYCFEQ